MRVDMIGPGAQALREIADPRMRADDVALTYAFAIRQAQAGEQVDFAAINGAIIERWSLAALNYIKTQAWRRLR